MKVILFLVIGGLFAGCAATANLDLSDVTAQKVADRIHNQSESIRYFSTSGYGSFETKEGAYTARFEMAIHRPSSAIVSIYGPFGIKVAQVRLTDDTLLVYNSMRNEVFMGKPTSNNIRNFLMIAADGNSFTDLLLDLKAPLSHNSGALESKSLDGDAVRFTYTDQDTVEVYTVDGQYMRTRYYEKSVDGETVMKIKYSDFASVGDVFFPRSISFEDLRHGVSARLYYQDTSLNQKEDMEFSVPPDAKEVILN